ncbi:MAG: hypothetical protein ACLPWD_06115 [Methanobacterium sp.]
MVLNRGIFDYIRYPPTNYAIVAIVVLIIIFILLNYDKYPITTLGFIFTPVLTILFLIIWDGYNSKKKDKSFYLNLGLEICINLISLKTNSELILNDLKVIPKKGHLDPLKPLRTEIWDLLKFNTPDSLFEKNLLGLLAVLYFKVTDINETIVSRENFRITNVDTSHFYSEIEIYDKNLFRYIEEFITLLERLLNFQELKNELGDIKRIETQLDELKSSNSKIKGFLDL